MTTATNAKQPATPRAKTISPKIEPEEIRDIEISKLTRLQVREATDPNVVERYMGALMAGAELPMPVVYELSDGSLLLSDGNHTTASHEKLKHATVRCRVRRGTRLDAIAHAGQANGRHGLPLTNLDKRRVVTMWFQEPGGRNLTDAVIAMKCGVSGRFVGLVREELGAVADARVNSKGKTIRTERIGRTLNGSELMDKIPPALQKLQEVGLLAVAQVIDFSARLKEHPDAQPLLEFLDSAEKIAARAVTGDTHPDLRDRLNAHVRNLLAANTNGQAADDASETDDTRLVERLTKAAAEDPGLTAVLKSTLDPKAPGGAASNTPIPADLAAKHPALAGLKTLGDMAETARKVLGKGGREKKGHGPGRGKAGRCVTSTTVNLAVGADPYCATVNGAPMKLRVKSVRIPRTIIMKALEASASRGKTNESGALHDFPEFTVGNVILVIA